MFGVLCDYCYELARLRPPRHDLRETVVLRVRFGRESFVWSGANGATCSSLGLVTAAGMSVTGSVRLVFAAVDVVVGCGESTARCSLVDGDRSTGSWSDVLFLMLSCLLMSCFLHAEGLIGVMMVGVVTMSCTDGGGNGYLLVVYGRGSLPRTLSGSVGVRSGVFVVGFGGPVV